MDDRTLTVDYVRKALTYDPDTGVIRRRTGPRSTQIAGWVTRHGRREIGFGRQQRRALASHCAWALHYGQWPLGEVDHRNGDPGDNRIANLRLATRVENQQNTWRRSDNTSGFPGVVFDRGRWKAQISVESRTVYLGRFLLAEDAYAAYLAAKHRLHPSWHTGCGAEI